MQNMIRNKNMLLLNKVPISSSLSVVSSSSSSSFPVVGLTKKFSTSKSKSGESTTSKVTINNWPRYNVETLHNTNIYGVSSLPLPPLKKTLARYLDSIEPITTKEELAQTRKHVEDFLRSDVAKKLHEELEKVASRPDSYPHSYIEKYWDEMYYGGRWPLMVHVNPFFLFHDDKNEMKNPCLRVAKFSVSLVRWWRKVVDGRLEPDLDGGKPSCSNQYGQVFGVERVPSETRDGLIRHPFSKHIIAIRGRNFYRIDVVSDDGKVVTPEVLSKQLSEIVSKKNSTTLSEDVGVLTSGGRTEYAKARKELEKQPGNKTSFRDIDTSLFVICLDNETWGNDMEKRSSRLLHGKDGGNRWWDKHQVVISDDGVLGMSFEHGCNDGLIWNRMCVEAYADMIGKPSGFSPLGIASTNTPITSVKHLPFSPSKTDISNIEEAAKAAKSLIDDIDTKVCRFDAFGRDTIKNFKVSPDAFAQMSFQLAYRKLHGHNAATYEACAMKHFYHGRTETIRSCTTQSSAMCDAFLNPNSTIETKRQLLQAACKKHIELAAGARNAGADDNLGCDRHLRALKCLAEEKGIPIPSIFTDPVYGRSTTWIISTSNVTSPIFDIFGFGAVATEGYGFGYMTSPKSIPMNITSFRSGQKDPNRTGSAAIAKEVTNALLEFQKVF